MMTKKITTLILVIAVSGTLTACNQLFHVTPDHQLTQEQTCNRLKRQRIYNKVNNNIEAQHMAPSQQQALEQALHDNHC